MALTVNSQNSTSFQVGSNLTLLCSAQSSPAAQLRWAVRGTLVDAAGPVLELSTVSQEQSGDYTCLAFNTHTHMRSSVTKHLLVTGKRHVSVRHLRPPPSPKPLTLAASPQSCRDVNSRPPTHSFSPCCCCWDCCNFQACCEICIFKNIYEKTKGSTNEHQNVNYLWLQKIKQLVKQIFTNFSFRFISIYLFFFLQ